jgi:hypothetical protein
MASPAQTTAIAQPQTEVSNTQVSTRTAQVGVMEINTAQVQRTLRKPTPAVATKPSYQGQALRYAAQPDGTIMLYADALEYDKVGLYS